MCAFEASGAPGPVGIIGVIGDMAAIGSARVQDAFPECQFFPLTDNAIVPSDEQSQETIETEEVEEVPGEG